ncbi:MAG TPA: M23 family metallopeptidase, partial [bacterium]|nr:M23 family metallopeptidase [bacterium]
MYRKETSKRTRLRIPTWAGSALVAAAAAGTAAFLPEKGAAVFSKVPEPWGWGEPSGGCWAEFTFPTGQNRLLFWRDPGVLQPTAAGSPDSARYGSYRTVKSGKRFLPAFHEGVDIAAREHNRRGVPADRVRAVARGTAAYVNRVAGNSSYGNYVVLVHDDPLGPVYTLYAHLGSIDPSLREGKAVAAGDVLGVIGTSSSSTRIPRGRAHLHFEVGLIANDRFRDWARSRKMKNPHRSFHGWNLLGLDPLMFFAWRLFRPASDFETFLKGAPRAFTLAARTARLPDWFRRYPRLWKGEGFAGSGVALACTANGVVLEGRNAAAAELAALEESAAVVTGVDGR